MTPLQLGTRIVVITFSRLLLNTAKRFIYTFAPALSRFLGVPLTSITSLIAINQGISVMGVVLAPLGDRFGYKVMMLAGLAFLAIGMFAAGIVPLYATLVITVMIAGLGKTVFDPAIQAYVGVRVPYQRRGLVIGILEFSWAGSTVVGIPLAGLLIERSGWQCTFLTLGGLALLCCGLILFFIPRDRGTEGVPGGSFQILKLWGNLLGNKAAIGALLFFFFVAIANDTVFVVYSSWLEGSFALGIVALGVGTSVIGFAEISGEVLTALFADRLGLKRAVLLGVGCSVLSYLMLPVLDASLALAFSALFLIFLSFEFTIVCSLSLATELAPGSRATMMSGVFAASGIGRVIGAMIGGPVWQTGGLWATGAVSAACSLLGLVALVWGLRSWQR